MKQNQSEAIVGFISSLLPLFTHEKHAGLHAARSLGDGTLVLPIEEIDPEESQGWVRVLWQGDVGRATEVDGSMFATRAVVDYVWMHQLGQTDKQIQVLLAHMSQHFQFKTGSSLYLPYPDADPDLAAWVQKGLGRLGEAGLIEVIKRAVGL